MYQRNIWILKIDVKIWCPKFSDNDSTVNEREIVDVKTAAANNQLQMNSRPLELLLLNAQSIKF